MRAQRVEMFLYGWFVRIEGLGLSWNGVDVLVECGWRVERLARIVGGKRELDARLVCLGVGCSGFWLTAVC